MQIVPCPLCSSTKHKELFTGRNRRDNLDCKGTYVQCSDCSLVYLRSRPQWQEIVKFYSLLGTEVTANSGQSDYLALQRLTSRRVGPCKKLLRKIHFRPHSWPLESVVCKSKRILDLGCGNGAKLIEFANRGYDIWGVDVSQDAIDICKKLLPASNFVVSELEKSNLPDNYFDYIRIDNALEHVPTPQAVINECYRMLKPGGELMIYVPHGRSFTFRVMKGHSISSWIPFHLQLFTKSSLNYVLTEAKFKTIKIYDYCPCVWLPLSIGQWKSRKLKKTTTSLPRWLTIVCYPIGLLMNKIGMAEELVAVVRKS